MALRQRSTIGALRRRRGDDRMLVGRGCAAATVERYRVAAGLRRRTTAAVSAQAETSVGMVGVESVTFEHWPRRDAGWMGAWDRKTGKYDVDWANVNATLEVVAAIVDRYAAHPAVMGLEPVNEPWNWTPLDALKRFYWRGYRRRAELR